MLIAASGRQVAYDALVAAHVVAALVGFGALALSGVYAGTARHVERPGSLEEAVRYFQARSLAEWAIVAVPVLGVLAVVADPTGHGLYHAWVAVALVLWLVAAGAAGWVGRPARAALRAELVPDGGRAAPPDPGAVRAAATRLAVAAAVCDVVFALAVIDMVIRP